MAKAALSGLWPPWCAKKGIHALLCGLLLFPLGSKAQQVLVEGEIDTVQASFGPNRRYYGHFFGGAGLVLGPAGGAGAKVRYGLPSQEVEVGLRFKRRYSQTLALTLAARYALLTYGLSQTSQKTVPNSVQHQQESLRLHQFQLEGGLRLNAGRRGNVIGRYLDLLAWGGRVGSTAHHTEDAPAPSSGAITAETVERGLNYLARWPAGLALRVGSGRFAITGRYRLTSAWQGSGAGWPELPRGVLGLEVGIF